MHSENSVWDHAKASLYQINKIVYSFSHQYVQMIYSQFFVDVYHIATVKPRVRS